MPDTITGGRYPARLPMLMAAMFSRPQNPNALSMSSSSKNEEYSGVITVPVALQTPMSRNANANIWAVCAAKKVIIDTVTAANPTRIIFRLPYLSASIPAGMVSMVELRAFIMKMLPRLCPPKPSDVRYSCITALNTPLLMPLVNPPTRKYLALRLRLSGTTLAMNPSRPCGFEETRS